MRLQMRLIMLGILCVVEAAADDAAQTTRYLLEQAHVAGGVCAFVGEPAPELAEAMVSAGNFYVHVWVADEKGAAQLREQLVASPYYGRQLTVECGNTMALPYADNSVDIVVVATVTSDAGPYVEKCLRALRPNGKVFFRTDAASRKELARKFGRDDFALDDDWASFTKPEPQGMDDWSHWYHNPDNNPVSRDTVIRAPYRTQWLGAPYLATMPAVTTAAGGRIFVATGHIAHREPEEPWLNMLIARNGYNGAVLWTRKLPSGYQVHRSAFIATDDVFYMIDRDACLMLDPETGRELDRVRIPDVSGEWKWMVLQDDVLYVLSDTKADPAENVIVRNNAPHWAWGRIGEGYYLPRIPWGFGHTLAAFDMKHRKKLWQHDEAQVVDSAALSLGGGRLYFHAPDAHTGCLDATTGRVIWTNDDAGILRLIEDRNDSFGGTPGFRTACYALYTPDALYFMGQVRTNIVAIAPDDGRLLWTRPRPTSNSNMLRVDEGLIVGLGPGGQIENVDPLTGKARKNLGFYKVGCVRLTATPDSFFCRGYPAGYFRYDRASGEVSIDAVMRAGCNDGTLGANGLLYFGPWPCHCNYAFLGMMAFTSAGDFDPEREDPISSRLQRYADAESVAPLETIDADWETYRGDTGRNAASSAKPSNEPRLLWTYTPEQEVEPTAPTTAGGLAFYAGNDGKVRGIDLTSGAQRWVFAAGGTVKRPPTIWNGRAYIGAGDGYVYCIEALTGRLLWRFRAAPVERRLMVYGRLSSNWPVHTGVVVHDGVAYAGAGLIDSDGTYICALDAVTGALKWRNNTSGHLNKPTRKGVTAHGTMTIVGDKLLLAGGNVVSPAVYDLATGACCSVFKGNGSAQVERGEEVARLTDTLAVIGGRLPYSITENAASSAKIRLVSVASDGAVGDEVLFKLGSVLPAWNDSVCVNVGGMNAMPTATTPSGLAENYAKHAKPDYALTKQYDDSVHWSEPKVWWAEDLKEEDTVSLAIAGDIAVAVHRKDEDWERADSWSISGLDLASGKRLWQRDLPGAALPGALAIDRDGRMIVVLEKGAIVCFS